MEIYHTRNVKLEGILALGDKSALLEVDKKSRSAPIGIDLAGYENDDFEISGCRVENMLAGIIPPNVDHAPPTVIAGCDLRNYTNLLITTRGIANIGGKRLDIKDTRFTLLDDVPRQDRGFENLRHNIYMNFGADSGLAAGSGSATLPTVVNVFNYNLSGADFRVYDLDSVPEHVVPPSNRKYRFTGSPEPGLNNAQLWAKYGVATAGAIAPCRVSDQYPGIRGFTCPLVAADFDYLAPSAPAGFTSTQIGPLGLRVSWLPSSDNVGVVGYWLWFDGRKYTTVDTSIKFRGLRPGKNYRVWVLAYDASGNQSGKRHVDVKLERGYRQKRVFRKVERRRRKRR